MFEDKRIPMSIPQEGVEYGNYRFQKVIGQGGSGISYLAWDIRQEKYCILKEFYPEELCDYFVRENGLLHIKEGYTKDYYDWMIRCLEYECNMSQQAYFDSSDEKRGTGSNSPYVYKSELLDEYVESSDVLFIRIETTSGETLKDWLNLHENIGERERIELIQRIFNAVHDSLHKKGIVHGDLNPENIYISGSNAVILDFGTAVHKNAVSEEEIFSTFLTAASLKYASERKKDILMLASKYRLICRNGINNREVDGLKEQIVHSVNQLSEYDDYYMIYVLLFYLLFGKYPFYADLIMMSDLQQFILEQPVNAIIKQSVLLLAKGFNNEDVKYVEDNFGNLLQRMVASKNPKSREAMVSELYESILEDYQETHDLYIAECIKVNRNEDSTVDYNILKNEILTDLCDGNGVLKILEFHEYKGKTCFLQNLCYEIAKEYPLCGVLPIYINELSESIEKTVKQLQGEKILLLVDSLSMLEIMEKFDYVNRIFCTDEVIKEDELTRYKVYEDTLQVESIIEDDLKIKEKVLVEVIKKDIAVLALIRKKYKETGKVITNLYSLYEADIKNKLIGLDDKRRKALLDDVYYTVAEEVEVTGIIRNEIPITSSFFAYCLNKIIHKKSDEKYQFIKLNHLYLLLAKKLIEDAFDNVTPQSNMLLNRIKLKSYPTLLRLCSDYIQVKQERTIQSKDWDSLLAKSKSSFYVMNIINIFAFADENEQTLHICDVDFKEIGFFVDEFPQLNKRVYFSQCTFPSSCFEPKCTQLIEYKGQEVLSTEFKKYTDKEVFGTYEEKACYYVDINEKLYELKNDGYVRWHDVEIKVINGYDAEGKRIYGKKKIYVRLSGVLRYKYDLTIWSCSNRDHIIILGGNNNTCYIQWMYDKDIVMFRQKIFEGRKDGEFLFPFYVYEINNMVLVGYKYGKSMQEIAKQGIIYSSGMITAIDFILIYQREDDTYRLVCEYKDKASSACLMEQNGDIYFVVWADNERVDVYRIDKEKEELVLFKRITFLGYYTSMVSNGNNVLVFSCDRSDKILYIYPFDNRENKILYSKFLYAPNSLICDKREGINFVPFSEDYLACNFSFERKGYTLYNNDLLTVNQDIKTKISQYDIEFQDCDFLYNENSSLQDYFVYDYLSQHSKVTDSTNSWQHKLATELDNRETILNVIGEYLEDVYEVSGSKFEKQKELLWESKFNTNLILEFIAEMLTSRKSLEQKRLFLNYLLYKIMPYETEHKKIEKYREIQLLLEQAYIQDEVQSLYDNIRKIVLEEIVSGFDKTESQRKVKWINRVFFEGKKYSFSQSMYCLAEQYYLLYKQYDSKDEKDYYLFDKALELCQWSSETEAKTTYNMYMLHNRGRVYSLLFRVDEMEERLLKKKYE